MGEQTVGGSGESGRLLLQRFTTDHRFDLCGVALVRLAVARYLLGESRQRERMQSSNGKKEVSALSEGLALEVLRYGSIDAYLRTEVLAMGKDVEGTMIPAAAHQLGVQLHICQLDAADGPLAAYTYPSEEYKSPFGIRVHLLFRPGHYEVLYEKGGPCFLDTTPTKCSFCGADATSQDVLVCAHCLCKACSSRAGNIGCLVCAGGLSAPRTAPQRSTGEWSVPPKKGDLVYRNRKACTVVGICHDTDPPHFVVRVHDTGAEVGTELDRLTRQAPTPSTPKSQAAQSQAPASFTPPSTQPLASAPPNSQVPIGASRMDQAVSLERVARSLEEQGRQAEALQKYKDSLVLFSAAMQKESNARVKTMLRERMFELIERAEGLKETTGLSEPRTGGLVANVKNKYAVPSWFSPVSFTQATESFEEELAKRATSQAALGSAIAQPFYCVR